MKNKRTLLILTLVLVLVIGGASALYVQLGRYQDPGHLAVQASPAPQQEQAPQELSMAPDITVYDKDGNAVHLSDYLGKPVVMNFWASWCGPCKMEMPDFDEKYKELGEDVQFLMINMTDGSRETVESASAFIEEQGYSFPILFDSESSAMISYRAFSLPSTYFINAQGQAVAKATGAIDGDTLQLGIDMIL